jgi:diacylglycerol kinase family enzyme
VHLAGLDLLDLRPVADPRLPQALAAAVDSGADLIVVGGGDGTLSEATHQLAHRDVCLDVLPLGPTNNFARSLRLPLHLPAALRWSVRAAEPDAEATRACTATRRWCR